MTTTRERNLGLLICLLLAVCTFAVYFQVRNFSFLNYDDDRFLSDNPHIRKGFTRDSVRWAFTADLVTDSKNADYWAPMTVLSRVLDVQLFGLNSASHHLMNVLYHVLAAALLFWALHRMTRERWRSALVAALFALHPLHVESVAWVAERKDVLSGCFWMLTMWAYIRYVEQPKQTRYLLSLGLYALGLMSKPMLVTLPFVLLLLDYWPLGRTRWAEPITGDRAKTPVSRLLWEKLPFLALALAASVLAFGAQHGEGSVSPLEKLPLDVRVPNAVVSCVRYLGKAFWPSRLAAFYPYEIWPLSSVLLAGAALLGVSGVVVWRARREPWLATGWFWFLGTLVPVIGLVQVGNQSMADRYTYIPLVGLFIMLCWSLPDSATKQRIWRIIAFVTVVAVLVVCAAVCRIQIGYWRDTETLFRHALDVTRNNWLAHNNLGVELCRRGKIDEGLAHLQRAIWLHPDYSDAYNNLGLALTNLRRLDEAMPLYYRAIKLNPGNAVTYDNLGVALVKKGEPEQAIEYFSKAVALRPDRAEAHRNLGIALTKVGRVREAIVHFEQALRIKPDSVEAHCNLGLALEQVGKAREAIGHYEQALQLKPDYPAAQNNLAWLLATVPPAEGGDPVRAVALAERACKLTGGRVATHLDTLAAAYAAAGRFNEAITTAQQAIGLASSAGQTQIVSEIEPRLKLYRAGRPYRVPASATSPPGP